MWLRFIKIIFLLIFSVSVLAEENPQDLSFDFQQIAVRDCIRLLAKYSEKNIILSDKVQNQEMSLHLAHVTWQQALQTVLASEGLGQREVGDTIIVSPLADITSQLHAEFQLENQQQQLAPLQSEVLSLRYAKAQELAAMLKDKNNNLLTARGNVGADIRTNSLWVEDTPSQLARVESLIQRLDVAAPQVSIEARVVTVDRSVEKDLGVRFGVSGEHHLSGTLAGANALANRATDVPLKDRLNFDFPSQPLSGSTGSLGLAMLKLADGYALDLELSALEAEGMGEIIAKPSLVTANQQPATIQTGEDIPYQERSYGGNTNVAFKKAVLSLEVTPQITPDQCILLNLHISQDKPSSKLVQGVPAIDTREITTQVLVKNNQTLVLGGIYEETESHQIERVPFLSSIPVLGQLFQHQHTAHEKRELLIFVRPSILEAS